MKGLRNFCNLLKRCRLNVLEVAPVLVFFTAFRQTSTNGGRTEKSNFHTKIEVNPTIEEFLAPFRQKLKTQEELFCQLKASGASGVDVEKADGEMKLRRTLLKKVELNVERIHTMRNRNEMRALFKKQFCFLETFANDYFKNASLNDITPYGISLRSNLVTVWRRLFVLEEEMLEFDGSALILEHKPETSDRIDPFVESGFTDVKSDKAFRADQRIQKRILERCQEIENDQEWEEYNQQFNIKQTSITKDKMDAILQQYVNKSTSQNELEPIEFELLYQLQFNLANLLPELAQGILTKFEQILYSTHKCLPFAVAKSATLIRHKSPHCDFRSREFMMADIVHFNEPNTSDHSKFSDVENCEMTLYSADHQTNRKSTERCTIGEAVASGLVTNKTLGYFMTRIQMYLAEIGISPELVRFRQHASFEVWDAECFVSCGWIKCVSCADRSKVRFENVDSSVVVLSFEIDWIMYTLLEHSLQIREWLGPPNMNHEGLKLFTLLPLVAPSKCAVLPLFNNKEFEPIVKYISTALTQKIDRHSVYFNKPIRNRYIQCDEVGIPFVITIDLDTLKQPQTVTLRERDLMDQVRVPLTEIADVVRELISGTVEWTDVTTKYLMYPHCPPRYNYKGHSNILQKKRTSGYFNPKRTSRASPA